MFERMNPFLTSINMCLDPNRDLCQKSSDLSLDVVDGECTLPQELQPCVVTLTLKPATVVFW